MAGTFGEIVRREGYRLRYRLPTVFCVTTLLVLAIGYSLPRSYVSEATLAWQASDIALRNHIREELRSAASASGDGRLALIDAGDSLALRWQSIEDSVPAQELERVLDTLTSDVRQRVVDEVDTEEARLQSALQVSRRAYEAASQQLNSAIDRLPDGGGAAAGAKLGQLQAEQEALELENAENQSLEARLLGRIEELNSQIGAGEPDDSRVTEQEQSLKRAEAALVAAVVAQADAEDVLSARQAEVIAIDEVLPESDPAYARVTEAQTLVESLQANVDDLTRSLGGARRELASAQSRYASLIARLGAAQEDLSSTKESLQTGEARQLELTRLVEQARDKLSQLEQDNVALRQLRSAYDTAQREFRELQVEARRHAQDAVRLRARPPLPFTIAERPSAARLKQGFESWQTVVGATSCGLALALLLLIGASLRGSSGKSLAKLTDELRVAPTVELPVWSDPIAAKGTGLRRLLIGLLMFITAAACIAFIQFA